MRRGGHNCARLSVLHALCSRRTARLWPGWPLLARVHGTLGASNDPQPNAGSQARSAVRHHRSPSSLLRQPGCACRRHGGAVAFKPHSAALTQGLWCRKVHARYKELLQVKELKASLLTAAHGVDQQRALAVRIPPPFPQPLLASLPVWQCVQTPGRCSHVCWAPAPRAPLNRCPRTAALCAGATGRPIAGGQSTRWPLRAHVRRLRFLGFVVKRTACAALVVTPCPCTPPALGLQA